MTVRAWVKFDPATGTIKSSGNVTSVTRSAAGTYTVNFTTALSDAFSVVECALNNSAANGEIQARVTAVSTSAISFTTARTSDGTAVDAGGAVYVAIYA